MWRGQDPVGVVHVRDTLDTDPNTTAADLMRPVLILPPDTPVYRALTTMRQQHSQFTLVKGEQGQLLGLVTMHDLLDRLLPST